jgi:hypothetical protein
LILPTDDQAVEVTTAKLVKDMNDLKGQESKIASGRTMGLIIRGNLSEFEKVKEFIVRQTDCFLVYQKTSDYRLKVVELKPQNEGSEKFDCNT